MQFWYNKNFGRAANFDNFLVIRIEVIPRLFWINFKNVGIWYVKLFYFNDFVWTCVSVFSIFLYNVFISACNITFDTTICFTFKKYFNWHARKLIFFILEPILPEGKFDILESRINLVVLIFFLLNCYSAEVVKMLLLLF